MTNIDVSGQGKLAHFLNGKRYLLVILCAGMLAGCYTTPTNISPKTQNNTLPSDINAKQSAFDSDLLYDILLASIAASRNRPEEALTAISDAALQSRDPHIISWAIQQATRMHAYEEALALGKIMNQVQPKNDFATLAIVNALFNRGEVQKALSTLIQHIKTHDDLSMQLLEEMAQLLVINNPETSLQAFLNHADNNSPNKHILFVATLVALELNDLPQAAQLLEKTLALDMNWPPPNRLNLNLLAQVDRQRLHEFAQDYLNRNPANILFGLHYVQLLIEKKEFDLTFKQLTGLLNDNPKSSDALLVMGNLHMLLGDFSAAKSYLERHLKLADPDDLALLHLAEIAISQENYQQATQYVHAISDAQYYYTTQAMLARVIAKRSGLALGLEHLKQLSTSSDEGRVRVILEQETLLREYREFKRAKFVLDQGLILLPDNPKLLYNRGLVHAHLNQIEAMEQDLRKVVELEPDNADAYNTWGYTLADQTQRLSEAKKLITIAHQILPDNPYILDSLGWVLYKMGDTQSAILNLKKALKRLKDAEIAAHLGEVLWQANDKDQALKIWEKGMHWGKDNTVLIETIKRFLPSKNIVDASSGLSGF